ncbi:MAG TPA: hypothetical protein VHW01_07550, partial [Polyangiaceae bacterium]|nr:hypothetical protein [Polyangiaceae bacterium]
QELDHCVMRFADHKLYLRSVPNGFLCVLSTNGVNTPALKMALTLTARRVDPLISEAAAAPSPSVIPPRASEAPKSSGAVSEGGRRVSYRGHRV